MDITDFLFGIEKFGLASLKSLDIYENKEEAKAEPDPDPLKEFDISNFTCEKDFECPVCENKFKSRVMRSGVMRPVATDYDLSPVYSEPIHPIFYDILICPNCGHAAIYQTFLRVNSVQVKLVLEQIKPNFHYVEYPALLDADMALERFKLALANAIVKQVKDSEKAYICMKIAWLYRSKKDNKNEAAFIEYAYKGYQIALENEYFPLLGMEQNTVKFVIAAYANKLGHYADAMKIVSQLVTATNISVRLKDKALDLKHEIERAKAEKENSSKEPEQHKKKR